MSLSLFEIIFVIVELDEYESAATLAEKYLDFIILVQICDKTKDDDRLMYYMDKYEKKVNDLLISVYNVTCPLPHVRNE